MFALEVIVIIGLFLWQIGVCLKAIRKCNRLGSFFPNRKIIRIVREKVESSDEELTRILRVDEDRAKESRTSDIVKSTILVTRRSSSRSLLQEVSDSINGYLKRNKGNAADFHLLKNIVDRHLDTVDEEIGHLIPVPLYIGLAGTMFGIITGLLSINGDVQSDAFVNSISAVVQNIQYAMMCSLAGLMMTTVLSAYVYRSSKARMERQKNDFLDFLLTELFPHLNEDATATLLNMQANLKEFNDQFRRNISGFSSIMNDVHKAFDSQVQLVKKLNEMDLVKMSRLNISVLDKLHESTSEFQKFTQYLNQMNRFVDSTIRLTNSVNSQLERTSAIEEVVQGVKENIDGNKVVMDMLQDFLTRVNTNGAVLEASRNIDTAVAEAMDNMKKLVEQEVETIKEYTTKATKDLDALMQRERGQLDKLRNLEKLDTLARAVQQMADDNKNVNTNLAKRISDLSNAIQAGPGSKKSRNGVQTVLYVIVAVSIFAACAIYIGTTVKEMLKPSQSALTVSNSQVQAVDSEREMVVEDTSALVESEPLSAYDIVE